MIENARRKRGIIDAAIGEVDACIAEVPKARPQIYDYMLTHTERAAKKQGTGENGA